MVIRTIFLIGALGSLVTCLSAVCFCQVFCFSNKLRIKNVFFKFHIYSIIFIFLGLHPLTLSVLYVF